tara:strand:- start:236 stop:616 length:381 start_codon:yes stop_codon:yes gene_type:complete
VFSVELLLHAKQLLDCASIQRGKLQTARTAIKLYLAMLGPGCAVARPGDRLDTGRCCLTTPSHCAQCALCTCCHSVFSSVWNGGAGSKNGEPRWPQSKISVTVTIIKDGQSLTAGREEQDRAKRVV